MTFMELLLSAKLGSTSAFEELFALLFAHCIEIFDVNR